ncbi:membrane protein insertion efficiency factor YidD [Woodsholea maritima]|uniref:membrane protein insertion efficiency factor YidD n=1 Tax=Woodsholea maritima TaxID=240237 RepID=UPI0003A36E1B|nr:membrane protein insertion efficiency factor YidD [Woodsholea maritima]
MMCTDCPSDPGVKGRVGLVERAALLLLWLYKYSLSPLFYALGVRCRHEPSCSAYSMDAIRAQGFWRGGWLTLGRLLRCRPGGTQGYDPAPKMPTPVAWWKVWAFRANPK